MSHANPSQNDMARKRMPLLEAKFAHEVVEVKIDPCFAVKQLFKCTGLTVEDVRTLHEDLKDLPVLEVEPKKKVRWVADEENFDKSFVEVSAKAKEAKGMNSFVCFDAKREDSLNPNYVTTYGPNEEVPYGIPSGSSSWCDDKVDAELYQVYKRTNSFLGDDVELKNNMKNLVTRSKVKESQLLNWHQRGPNPLRYLMGHLLLSTISCFNQEIKKVSPMVLKKIVSTIDQTVEDLESEKISIYVLYEAGAKIFKKNTGLLKTRSKIMKEYLGILD